jgi:hypothetical protein
MVLAPCHTQSYGRVKRACRGATLTPVAPVLAKARCARQERAARARLSRTASAWCAQLGDSAVLLAARRAHSASLGASLLPTASLARSWKRAARGLMARVERRQPCRRPALRAQPAALALALLKTRLAHLQTWVRVPVAATAAGARAREPAPVAHLASSRMPRVVWSARQQLVLVLMTADAFLAALARLVPRVKPCVSSARQGSTSPRLAQARACLARLANTKTRSAH